MSNAIQPLEGQDILGYIDTIDPGKIGAGRIWIDTSGGSGAYRIKIRNAADTGWETVGIAFDEDISEATLLRADPAPLADEDIPAGYLNISLDEDNDAVVIKAKKSTGEVFTVTLSADA